MDPTSDVRSGKQAQGREGLLGAMSGVWLSQRPNLRTGDFSDPGRRKRMSRSCHRRVLVQDLLFLFPHQTSSPRVPNRLQPNRQKLFLSPEKC